MALWHIVCRYLSVAVAPFWQRWNCSRVLLLPTAGCTGTPSLPFSVGGSTMLNRQELQQIRVIRWRGDVESPYGFGIIACGPNANEEVYISSSRGRALVREHNTISLGGKMTKPPRTLMEGDTIWGFVWPAVGKAGNKCDWVHSWGLDETVRFPGQPAQVLVTRTHPNGYAFGVQVTEQGELGQEVFIPPNSRIPKPGWIIAGMLRRGTLNRRLTEWISTGQTREVPGDLADPRECAHLRTLHDLGDPRKVRFSDIAGL